MAMAENQIKLSGLQLAIPRPHEDADRRSLAYERPMSRGRVGPSFGFLIRTLNDIKG